jgi:hypothetical protein
MLRIQQARRVSEGQRQPAAGAGLSAEKARRGLECESLAVEGGDGCSWVFLLYEHTVYISSCGGTSIGRSYFGHLLAIRCRLNH